MSMYKCYFKSVDNLHEPIEMVHGQEFIFGRGRETRIKDFRCSRSQVKITADCIRKEASVTQIGRNACGVNGMALSKDYTVIVKEGDRIEVLLGQFVHVLKFESEAGDKSDSQAVVPSAKKDNLSESEEDEEEGTTPQPRVKIPRRLSDSDDSNQVSDSRWESVDDGELLVYTHPDVKPSSLIAGYDLDGTVIGTKSGGVFPKHMYDWKILYPEVMTKLKEMHENGYKIVIFTNQAGMSSGKTNDKNFRIKIESVVKKIGLPIQVFIATGYSFYRKPAVGMWEAVKKRNNGIDVDMSKSFYCGDAAGREAGPGHKKDFSQADFLFAKNLNLRFETPEHHFLKKEMPSLKINIFDPKAIPCDIPLCTPSWGQIISNKSELIVLVGCPGSGKSHFVKTHLIPAGYVHVNRDTLGSWIRCVSVMETALRSKQKVVVDNTNPDVESRKRYINVAKNYTSIIRCFIMNTSFDHAKHNNKFRRLTDPSHAIITNVVMHTFNSKYKEPTLSEGFTEILRINFWPTFKNPDLERIYKLFLLEK